MKSFRHFLAACLLTTGLCLPAQAIISDPEDHILYDTGKMGPLTSWEAPAFFGGHDWAFGFTGTAFSGRANMCEWCGVENEQDVYAIVVQINGQVVLDLPNCDSIYVEWWGTGQRGIKITSSLNDNYAWKALEGNRPGGKAGLRVHSADSVRIFLNPTKLDMDVLPTGPTFIERIKIYSYMEPDDIPPFDGTHSAWDFKYLPTASGTVDLETEIKAGDGMKNNVYGKYASDLGVVRSMLVPAGGMRVGYDDNLGCPVARQEGLSAFNPAYVAGTKNIDLSATVQQATNHYEITAPFQGFQDLTLSFQYAIDNFDTILVAWSEYDSVGWKHFDTVAVSEKATLQTAEVAVPSQYNNLKTSIRLVPWGSASGGKFTLVHLSLNGFQDYYAKDENAKKIAYIDGCPDRVHTLNNATTADSSDVLLKSLMKSTGYDVKIFTQADWNGLTAETAPEAFKDYSVVILSDFVPDDASILAACSGLGSKPFLNLKTSAHAQFYPEFQAADGLTDLVAVTEAGMSIHPIFKGTDVSTSQTQLPALTNDSLCPLSGVTGTAEGQIYILATSQPGGAVTMMEDYRHPEAKYLYVALSRQASASLSKEGYTMLTNAIEYLCKNSAFVAPEFELTSDGARVNDVTELRAAAAYPFSTINIDRPVVALTAGAYDLGNEPIEVNSSDITFQPDSTPGALLQGVFQPAAIVGNITFRDLPFEPAQGQSSFVQIQGDKGIDGELCFDHCRISGFEGPFVDACEASSANLKVLSFNSCTVSGNRGGLLAADGTVYVDSLALVNTLIEDDLSEALFRLDGQDGGSDAADNVRAFYVDHCLFYQSATPAGTSYLFKAGMSGLEGKKVSLTLTNSICYQVGKFAVELHPDYVGTFDLTYNLLIGYEEGESLPDEVVLTDEHNYYTAKKAGVSEVFDADRMIPKVSALYTAGRDRTYLGPDFVYAERTEPREVTVANVPELKTALEIAMHGDVILLDDCSDASGIYELGDAGFAYPTDGGRLTIQNAPGKQPKLFGRISPTTCRMDTLIFRGLTFTCDSTDMPMDASGNRLQLTGYDKDTYAPFTVSTDITAPYIEIDSCSFLSLQNQFVFRTRNCANATLGEINIHHSLMDNMGGYLPDGKLGAHLVQFEKGDKVKYDLHSFTFQQNIVKDFHGSQMFNVTRQNSNDSVYVVTISNNLFYRVGGNADSKRNFVEFTCEQKNATVLITIVNNIFDQRWSSNHQPVCLLAVPESGKVKAESAVLVSNNFFEGEYYTKSVSYGANPMAVTDGHLEDNLAVSVSNPISLTYGPAYDAFKMMLDDEVLFPNGDYVLALDSDHDLYTAGIGGTYIGPACLYYIIDGLQPAVDGDIRVEAYADNGILFVKADGPATVEVFDLVGRCVRQKAVRAGVNAIEGLPSGIYGLRLNGHSVKLCL